MTITPALPLDVGAHPKPSVDQLKRIGLDPKAIPSCAMERAYLAWALEQHKADPAGWPLERVVAEFGDNVPCASDVLRSAVIRFNDRVGLHPAGIERRARAFTDEVLSAIATSGRDRAIERQRGYALADWGLRFATPLFLELGTTLVPWAPKLRALAPIVDDSSLFEARKMTSILWDEAVRARGAMWDRLRAAAMAEAGAVAVAAGAMAAAMAEAEAAAEAGAVAVAVAVAAETVAVAVAAETVAVAVADRAFTADVWAAAKTAAKKSRDLGRSPSSQIAAARTVFSASIAQMGPFPPRIVAVRDRVDDSFRSKLLELCALR